MLNKASSIVILLAALFFPINLSAYDSGIIDLPQAIGTTEHCNGNVYDPGDPGCVAAECRVTWTNDHWKLNLEFTSDAAANGIHALFCGDFDYRLDDQTNEDLEVSLNGATYAFIENGQYYDGFRKFIIPGAFNVVQGMNRMEITHPYFSSQTCGSAAGGSIHFGERAGQRGWFRLSDSGAMASLKVVSAGFEADPAQWNKGYVKFYKDGTLFYEAHGGGAGGTGIHVAIIDYITGNVDEKRYFDTYLEYDEWVNANFRHEGLCNLATYLNGMERGKIVMIGIADEAGFIFWADINDPKDDYPWPDGLDPITGQPSPKLPMEPCVKAAYEAIESLGSIHIRHVGYRGSWAMIVVKGGDGEEAYSNNAEVSVTKQFGRDSDGDGAGDLADVCPDIANSGQENFDGDCFGNACDPDDDNDGVSDANDACPYDPGKSASQGQCGCGNLDAPDTDGDGTADCIDRCLRDPTTITPPCRAEYPYPLGPARVHFQVGDTPFAVTRGDFNGDQNEDIVVANYGSASISILTGDGRGDFNDALFYNVGTNPVSVTVTDFDQDSRLDVAVSNSGSHTVSILRGRGDGTLEASVDYPVGTTPWIIGTADFDGINGPDLATANSGGSDISVLLSNGDGTFQPAVAYPVGGSLPRSLAIGDFNSDNQKDLAVTVRSIGKVAILIGNGDGTFKGAVLYATGREPHTIVSDDFNGDGRLDLVTGNNGAFATLLLGQGDGTFPSYKNLGAGWAAFAVVSGDFNSDGKKDLSLASGLNNIVILLGHGDGTFGQAANYPTGWLSWWVPGFGPSYGHFTTVDFNKDGNPDLVLPHTGTSNGNYPSNTISVFFGRPDGTFQTSPDYPVGQNPLGLSGADFNGDGNEDLAIANGGGANVSIFLGNGDGTFFEGGNLGVGVNPFGVVVADFNGDRRDDLAVSNRTDKNVSILIGNADGTFQPAVNYSVGATPFWIVVADFDRDNNADLATAGFILRGNGDGSFGPAVKYGVATNISSDFNGDGMADIAAVSGSRLYIYRGNGNGLFQPAISYVSSGKDTRGVTAADFDRDGKIDMAVANMDTNQISLFRGKGDGTLQAPVHYPTGLGPISILSGDFDGDGLVDIVTPDWYARDIGWLAGNGDGTLQRPAFFGISRGASGGPATAHAADFNNDGKKDLAITNFGVSTVTILMGQ